MPACAGRARRCAARRAAAARLRCSLPRAPGSATAPLASTPGTSLGTIHAPLDEMLLAALLDLLYPPRCPACAAPTGGAPFCPTCADALEPPPPGCGGLVAHEWVIQERLQP